MMENEKKKRKKRLGICLKLDYDNDVEIIYALDQVEKKQTFIKELIRDRIYHDKALQMPDNM